MNNHVFCFVLKSGKRISGEKNQLFIEIILFLLVIRLLSAEFTGSWIKIYPTPNPIDVSMYDESDKSTQMLQNTGEIKQTVPWGFGQSCYAENSMF